MPPVDPRLIRPEFPSLDLEVGGRPVVYLDGPGGTQVHGSVIEAMVGYLRTSNANLGGAFLTSERSDAILAEGRAAVADLYAAAPEAITFGQNMTSLTFHVSRSIAATMRPGDEIVVTTLDHEANVSPWWAVAADRGLTVRTVDIHDDGTLDLAALEATLGERTRLVAVGYASNALGTINPVADIIRRAHAVGAWVFVDAVAYAPHASIDVGALDADFLVTSAYKWYGPHLGALYVRPAIAETLPAYKVRPAEHRFETGTQAFEAIAGAGAAVDYLASLGVRFGGAAVDASRRERLVAGLGAIRALEIDLHAQLMRGLRAIPGVRVWGPTDPSRAATGKAPTISITFARTTPPEAAARLGAQGIFTWDGHFYAQALIERLGVAERGGILRLGLSHYTTPEEIDRTLEAIESIALTEHAGASA